VAKLMQVKMEAEWLRPGKELEFSRDVTGEGNRETQHCPEREEEEMSHEKTEGNEGITTRQEA